MSMRMPKPKRFWLLRVNDVSGVSGTGVVAHGVIFENGQCAMSWLTQYSSIAIYSGIGTLKKIHEHNGATKLIFEGDKNYEKYMEDLKF